MASLSSLKSLPDGMADCIENCNTCYTACVVCIREHARQQAMADCIRACLDCLQTTRASAHLMSTGSTLHHQACALCADACQKCYDACSQMDNPYCQQCAQACADCVKSCRAMAA